MNPGSKEALKAGCTCPIMDNNNGRGVRAGEQVLFWYTQGCPVHVQNKDVEK